MSHFFVHFILNEFRTNWALNQHESMFIKRKAEHTLPNKRARLPRFTV